MNYLAWFVAVALWCSLVALIIVALHRFVAWSTRGFWPEDPVPCESCTHDWIDHQFETANGACAHLPCGCRAYKELP